MRIRYGSRSPSKISRRKIPKPAASRRSPRLRHCASSRRRCGSGRDARWSFRDAQLRADPESITTFENYAEKIGVAGYGLAVSRRPRSDRCRAARGGDSKKSRRDAEAVSACELPGVTEARIVSAVE